MLIQPKTLLFSFTLLLLFITTHSYLIGIDIGSEFFKACVIKPGKPFSMLENLQSKTKTPTVMSIKDDEIVFGAEALSKKARFPKNIFTFFEDYLGEKYDSPFVQEFLKDFLISYDIEEDPARHSITFNIKFNNQNEQLSPEEIYGMLFNHIKFLAEKYAKITITECFVTIPSFFNYKQRNALAQGIKISKLYLLGFITENLAAAVQYQLKNVYEEKKYYIFYNMGASYTQVSLVSYETLYTTQQGEGDEIKKIDIGNDIQILGEAWNRKLGGNRFNKVIIDLIMEKFDALPERKGKPSVKGNKKIFEKLIPHSIKYKEILSANKETHVAVLGLESNMNFEGRILRQEFNDASKELYDQVYEPIELLLNKSGLTIENITQIELIGGGIRIPMIQEVISERLGNYSNILGAHMNGDDSMAFGTAFMAANSSGKIRLSRKTFMTNGANAEINIFLKNFNITQEQICQSADNDKNASLTPDCVLNLKKNTTLLRFRHGYDIKRTVSIHHDSDIDVEVQERMENDDKDTTLMNFHVTGIDELKKEMLDLNITALPYIILHFNFNKHGELSMIADGVYNTTLYYGGIDNNGTIDYDYRLNYTAPLSQAEIEEIDLLITDINKTIDNYTEELNLTIALISNTSDNETTPINSTKANNTAESNDTTEANDTASANQSATEPIPTPVPVEESPVKILKEKIRNLKKERKSLMKKKNIGVSRIKENKRYLKVTIEHTDPKPMTDEQISDSKRKLVRLEEIDNNRIKVIEIKNTLEQRLFEDKEFLLSDNAALLGKEEEIAETKELIENISLWYEDEGYAANYTVLYEQMTNLSNGFNKYQARIKIYEDRKEQINAFIKYINITYTKVGKLLHDKPWVEEYFNKTYTKDVEVVTTWFNDSMNNQSALKLYEPTNFTAEAIKAKISILDRAYRRMANIPKPKEDKKPKNMFSGDDSLEDLIRKANLTKEEFEELQEQLRKDSNETNTNQTDSDNESNDTEGQEQDKGDKNKNKIETENTNNSTSDNSTVNSEEAENAEMEKEAQVDTIEQNSDL